MSAPGISKQPEAIKGLTKGTPSAARALDFQSRQRLINTRSLPAARKTLIIKSGSLRVITPAPPLYVLNVLAHFMSRLLYKVGKRQAIMAITRLRSVVLCLRCKRWWFKATGRAPTLGAFLALDDKYEFCKKGECLFCDNHITYSNSNII